MMTKLEIAFAKGDEFSETNRMRIGYTNLDRLHPHARYPTIHKTRDDGKGEFSMSLTPAEAQWVVDVLMRLLRS